MQLMQGFMVAVGHKFCIVSINFNVVSLLFHMHSKLWQFICVVCIRDFFFQFCELNKMRDHMQKKTPNLVEIALGKQKHLQKLPKEVIATVQNFGQKKKLWFACNFKNVFSLLYMHAKFWQIYVARFPCNSNCFSSFITICPGELLVHFFHQISLHRRPIFRVSPTSAPRPIQGRGWDEKAWGQGFTEHKDLLP